MRSIIISLGIRLLAKSAWQSYYLSFFLELAD